MKKIVAFGNPLLDTIVLTKNEGLLHKYQIKENGQKEVSQDVMNQLINDLKDCEKSVTAGGCAQNTLRVLQWLLQKQSSATMFGAVGNDEEGEILRNILRRHGVETAYIIHEGYATGASVALVSGDNRALIAYLGAAEIIPLDKVKLNSNLLTQIESADLIYMEGFFLTKRTEAASFILDYCSSRHKKFAFNLSAEYLCREYSDTVQYFLEKSSIIFGNRKEFETFCSLTNQSIDRLLENLGEQGKIVVVTNGASSVLCVSENQKSELEVPPLKIEEVVDTTGAGDSFVAGFLSGLVSKKPVGKCLELGCYAAQEIIKRRGCTIPEYSPRTCSL